MNDAYFFLGLFAFVFVIWLVTGGPHRPLSFAGPVLTTHISSQGVSFSGGNDFLPLTPSVSYRAASPSQNTAQQVENISAGVQRVSGEVRSLSQKVSRAVAFAPPSRYRGIVFLEHYVSHPGATDPAQEYVRLRVSVNAPGPVDISGWRLESGASGAAATIPEGTEVPLSGVINASQPIVLNPGDTAIISTGQSPLGASFRENECTGYFSQYQSFYPPLPQICPTPYHELQKFYGQNYLHDYTCINYVQNLNRCTLVAAPPANVSGACVTFLTNYLNYNGCVNAHQNDPNFKGTVWRIYLGRNQSMWRKNYEVVKLLDKNGKTVDMFSY